MNDRFIGYVGTYTKGNSEGIYTFTFDPEKPEIGEVKAVANLENPTYLTISTGNKYLYSAIKRKEMGGVAGYSINSKTGELETLNNQVVEGAPPCHVSVDSKNRYLVTGNYHKGTVEAYRINNENGTVSPAFSTIKHEGSGPHERQEKPHIHYTGFTPDEEYVVVIDLGSDNLITYEINNDTLTEVNRLSVKPGSGPRHLEFHPNGKYAYMMTELSSEVIVLAYSSEDGSFKELQYISTIPEDFNDNNQGSAIHVSSDGHFVYAGNRGHDSLAIFNINPDSGELTFVEHTSTGGNWPRDFVLDPTEKFLIASNQNSSNLVLFSRDVATGKLELLQSDVTVPDPVCVKFLDF
ncbi:lactonase family protein [Virgibacillus natechei]|uniref:lactonase family protein n=1 Tax=Virgibacillus sp. CBA3643 TaxID=2942278 RepID=UPI0035A3CE62